MRGFSVVPQLFCIDNNNAYSFVKIDNPTWDNLNALFAKYNLQTPLCFFPPELYLELHFLYACKKSELPATAGNVYNLPWTIAAAKLLRPDCIVSTAKVFPFLLQEMEKEGLVDFVTCVVLIAKDSEEAASHHISSNPAYTLEVLSSPLATYAQ